MMSSDISEDFLVLLSNGDKLHRYDFHWEGLLNLKQNSSFMQHKVNSNRYCKLKITSLYWVTKL